MKHSPAPWTVGRSNRPNELNIGIRGDDYVICDMCDDGHGVRVQMANACLIASAPELLEALKSIAEYWNRDRNDEAMHNALWFIIETATEAIAKAEGA